MANQKTVFRCQQCGHVSPKWLGRCPDCQSWHSLVEEVALKQALREVGSSPRAKPRTLSEIPFESEDRLQSGIGEWDRVLGGGLMSGSVVLLAGEPGIGKSTLLLQAMAQLARKRRVLYVSGEESPQQLKLRSLRLKIDPSNLYILAESELENLLAVIEQDRPELLAVDSIQTLHARSLDVAPGSLSQVRECAARLMREAKERNIGTFLIGHVTKEGSIAGPKALEHLVDTVISLEGDRTHTFRLLRAVKNRYGSTNEVGVFEMKETGLEEVPNPSQLLLAERPEGVSGSVVACAVEGTRPLLVELQALVCPTGWMQPRRTSMGVDGNRLSLLLAVLEKKVGFNFGQHDVFVNVAGGVRLLEPAADLAMTAALISTYLDRPLPQELVIWGEVGLAGEIRGVGHTSIRAMEANKMGFGKILLPKSNADRLSRELAPDCLGVRSLREVLELLFERP